MTMRKGWGIIIIAAILFLSSGCDAMRQEADYKPQQQEAEDSYDTITYLTEKTVADSLDESSYFWSFIGPEDPKDEQAYTLKDVSIFELDDQSYKGEVELFISVSAESAFASYTGNFIVRYRGSKEDGYSLSSVYQDYTGVYEITALPTESIAETFYIQDHSSYDQGNKLLNVSVNDLGRRAELCKAEFERSYQQDAYCTANEHLYYFCQFKRGRWVMTWEASCDPEITYEYHLPSVSTPEIANAIADIIPDFIGTYDGISGIVTSVEADPFTAEVSGCIITSLNPSAFDTSDVSVTLYMRCRKPEYTWECYSFSMTGNVCLPHAGEFQVSSTDWVFDYYNYDSTTPVDVSPTLTFDQESGCFYVTATITDKFKGPSEPIERTMHLIVTRGASVKEHELGIVYYASDDFVSIDFNKDMIPVNWGYPY